MKLPQQTVITKTDFAPYRVELDHNYDTGIVFLKMTLISSNMNVVCTEEVSSKCDQESR